MFVNILLATSPCFVVVAACLWQLLSLNTIYSTSCCWFLSRQHANTDIHALKCRMHNTLVACHALCSCYVACHACPFRYAVACVLSTLSMSVTFGELVRMQNGIYWIIRICYMRNKRRTGTLGEDRVCVIYWRLKYSYKHFNSWTLRLAGEYLWRIWNWNKEEVSIWANAAEETQASMRKSAPSMA